MKPLFALAALIISVATSQAGDTRLAEYMEYERGNKTWVISESPYSRDSEITITRARGEITISFDSEMTVTYSLLNAMERGYIKHPYLDSTQYTFNDAGEFKYAISLRYDSKWVYSTTFLIPPDMIWEWAVNAIPQPTRVPNTVATGRPQPRVPNTVATGHPWPQ